MHPTIGILRLFSPRHNPVEIEVDSMREGSGFVHLRDNAFEPCQWCGWKWNDWLDRESRWEVSTRRCQLPFTKSQFIHAEEKE